MELLLNGLPLPLRITPPAPVSDEALMRFSAQNELFPIELDSNGDILVMSPTGQEGSEANVELVLELALWNRQLTEPGGVTDSNGGYRLPDGSVRAPDAGWIAPHRMRTLSREQRRRYTPFAPDFAVELRSPSDSLRDLQEKMSIWMRNGVELAWLIDPEAKAVTVYRPNREPEYLQTISQIAGEGPVAGFVLPLDRIFV